MDKIPVYVIYGAQGSGKSTQGERLAKKLGWPFFDAGTALRQFAEDNPSIAAQMQAGQLVNNDTLEAIITAFLSSHTITDGLVIDGFPRTLTQCELLEKLSRHYNWSPVAVYIKISDQTVYDRLTKRAQTEGRADDQIDIIAKRLSNFKTQTLPAIDHFHQNHRVIEIDGEPSADEVTTLINHALGL